MWLWRLRAASCRRTSCGWRAEDSAQAPRLPALAQGLDGHSRSWAALAQRLDGHFRSWAALAGGMNRRTPRDWARRYNAASATALAAAQVHPLSVRPRHPQAGQAAQQTFKKNFALIVRRALPARARGKPLEVWFRYQARIGQKHGLPNPIRRSRYQASSPVRGAGKRIDRRRVC